MTGYLPFIEECLQAASTMARQLTGGVQSVKAHDVNQVVTDADLAIGGALVERIRAAFPRHGVLEEESGAVAGSDDVVWVVDPLDGSSNYAAGSPLYGIMIAVVDSAEVVASGIALPAFDEYYLAEAGRGASLNGMPLVTPPCGDLADRLVAFGCDKGDELDRDGRRFTEVARQCLGLRMSNSIFDVALVARGVYAAFTHSRCRIWDVAAAACLLRESGGRCTNFAGHPLDFGNPLSQADANYDVVLAAPGTPPLAGS
ncbi:inositol monophosphatase [Amycolatopsis sp. H6(2020)]|nr:inositol monophosphatase [Amycolatopsis sp. H6(2020)]